MKPPILSFLLGISLVLVTSGSAPAGNSGHMLDNLELIPGEKISYLTLKGTFDPKLFTQIKIEAGDSSFVTRVTIPHAFINNLLMPNREITQFPKEDIIERILLEEDIRQETNNKVSFLVNLQISHVETFDIQLDLEKSTPRQLTFSLQQTGQTLAQTDLTPSDSELISGIEMGSRESVLLHPVFAMLAYRQPLRMNVAVLNASRHVGGAQRLAILLEQQQRRRIEQRIGMRMEIVNISSVQEKLILPRTKIYFRPNMLKAAITLADVIPGEQIVEELKLNRGANLTTDVEIYVGENFE